MKTIAVLSGKGGVGKTTLSLKIAETLSKKFSVAIFDADVTASKTQCALKIVEDLRVVGDRIYPATAELNGVRVKYLGLGAVTDAYVKWQGDVVGEFVDQLMKNAVWDSDFLIIDCAPGVHEDAVKAIELSDVTVLVTIPSTLAFLDLQRVIDMLTDMEKPIAGIYLNMSKAICPHCGRDFKVFNDELRDFGVPIIEELPITSIDSIKLDFDKLLWHINNPTVLRHRRSIKRVAVKSLLRLIGWGVRLFGGDEA